MDDFHTRIAKLDLSLFSYVSGQSTDGDKRSLLALQSAIRETNANFVYLEIGSYLGGSLQPYVADPRCAKIVSIDTRPPSFPDVRGTYTYQENTTRNMLKQLERVAGANLDKITTFEQGTDKLNPANIQPLPDLCFVDGEHTDEAVLRDSRFCLELLKQNGCIAYHDANIIYNGIAMFIKELENAGRSFRAGNLLDSVFYIELGNCRISESPVMRELRDNNFKGYLWSLASNEHYRAFYYRNIFQVIRSIRAKTWGRFVV